MSQLLTHRERPAWPARWNREIIWRLCMAESIIVLRDVRIVSTLKPNIYWIIRINPQAKRTSRPHEKFSLLLNVRQIKKFEQIPKRNVPAVSIILSLWVLRLSTAVLVNPPWGRAQKQFLRHPLTLQPLGTQKRNFRCFCSWSAPRSQKLCGDRRYMSVVVCKDSICRKRFGKLFKHVERWSDGIRNAGSTSSASYY